MDELTAMLEEMLYSVFRKMVKQQVDFYRQFEDVNKKENLMSFEYKSLDGEKEIVSIPKKELLTYGSLVIDDATIHISVPINEAGRRPKKLLMELKFSAKDGQISLVSKNNKIV